MALLDSPEIGRGRDEARAELMQLLGDDPVLVGRLADLVVMADVMAHTRAWWHEAKVKEMRRSAADFARSLDSLDWLEFQEVEADVNVASSKIFTGWTLSPNATTDPDVARRMDEYCDDPNDASRGFLVRLHAQVQYIAAVGARGRGRPPDEVRRRVALEAAKRLLLAGRKAPVSDTGFFADVLRVILRRANLAPPTNMFRVTSEAMKDIKRLMESDPELKEAVQEATRQRRVTDGSGGRRTRSRSSSGPRSAGTRRSSRR